MYIKKQEFHQVLTECYEQDKITNKCVENFIKIAKGLSRKFKYKDLNDREDCIQEGILNAIKYWRNYDMTHPSANPFSYFSQLIKTGMATGFKKIHGKKENRMIKISLSETFNF